ncbi:MAG: hypothetical protein IJI25_06955 [Eubacterium sp.]|nr:hypothetical protein [Eubacterium sp.]
MLCLKSVRTLCKNCFLVFCTMLLCMSVCLPACRVSAAGKTKLSRIKLSLRAGSSGKITLKNTKKTVKWTISGKKLVTVKAGGKKKQTAVIKAGKKTGSCYVRAKAGKKTYTCKVTITKKKSGFTKKAISSQSVNMTGKMKAGKVSGREADDRFVGAVSDSSVTLLKETMKGQPGKKNILISPDSILTAVTMMEKGAGGENLTEMQTALGGISPGDYNRYLAGLHGRITGSKAIKYQMANSVWYKRGSISLKKPFLRKLVDYYRAEVYAAPFHTGTVKDINAWVYNNTSGKIKSIIDRLEADARVAVLNAIYFKGAWAEPYQTTVQRTFTKEDGSKRETPMLEGTEHIYLNVRGADGFVKYYQGGDTAFMGLLPPKGISLAQYVGQLTGKDLTEAYKNRLTSNVIVHTRLPEFSYEYQCSLKEPLKNMGIKKAFSPAADFSQMTSSQVQIDQILHKTFIKLNKNGTEAAAVTAVLAKASAAPTHEKITEKTVYLDRPFVYAIIDTKTGIPLFLGAVYSIK